jgi:hypothetical protein
VTPVCSTEPRDQSAQPKRTPDDIEEMVIQLRVAEKWGPDRIAGHLATVGDGSITIAPATVHRILMRHGISRLRDLDMPTGESSASHVGTSTPHLARCSTST